MSLESPSRSTPLQRELSTLFDATLHPVAALRGARLLYANPPFAELVGESLTLRGKALRDLVISDDREALERLLRSDSAPAELSLRLLNGRTANVVTMQLHVGDQAVLLLRSQQLSPSHQHPVALPRDIVTADRPLWDLLERAGTGFWLVDPLGRTMVCNAQAAHLVGSTIEELYRSTLFDRLGVAGTGIPAGVHHMQLKRRDGTSVQLEVAFSTFLDEDNRPGGAIALLRDMSAQRQMLRELARSEARFRALTETDPCAVCVMGPMGPIYEVNRAAEAMFGYGRNEWLNGEVRADQVYANPKVALEVLERVRAEERISDLEVTMRRRDGALFPALLNVTRFFHEDDELLAVSIVDLTRRAPAGVPGVREAELVNNVLAAIHDRLQTPLSSLHGFLSALHEDLSRAPGEAPAHVERLVRISRSLEQLVGDIGALARLTPGAVAAEPVSLDAEVRAAIGQEQPALASRKVELTVQERLGQVLGDARLIRYSVVRLLRLMLHASPDGAPPALHFGARTAADGTVLFIESPSTAMAPETFAALAQPLAHATIFSGGPAALELPAVRRVMELHRGRVFSEERQEGGTRVCLLFPQMPTGNR